MRVADKLLASPGEYDGRFFLWRWLHLREHRTGYAGYKTKEGFLFHGPGKRFLRKLISLGYSKYKNTIEKKRAKGYIKDHIAAMDEAWQWVMSLNDKPTMKMGNGMLGFGGPDDANRIMFNQVSGISFAMLDEDTYYDIRVLLWLKWIHEHWDRFEQSAGQAYSLTAGFDKFYKAMRAWTAPLPQDDGKPEKEIDYIALEKKLTGDKKWDGQQ